MKQFRIQLVIAFIVLICGVSLMGLIYIVFNKPYVPVNPGVVVSHPSSLGAPYLPSRSGNRSRIRSSSTAHYMQNMKRTQSIESTVTMPATRTYSLWSLSSAKISNSGSGTGGNIAYPAPASTGSRSSGQRGIHASSVSVTMPMTTFVAMADVRMVAAPAAQEAPQMAQMAVRKAPPPPNPGGNLEEENQLVPHPECPVGDALLPLLLLAMAYVGARSLRKDATKGGKEPN